MKVKDFLVSNEEFSLLPHPKFEGLLQTVPMPDLDRLPEYYKSEAYISHSDSSKGLLNSIYYLVKKFNLNLKYNLIRKTNSGRKVLDYGCGTGELVSYLNSKDLDAYGFEPNENANELASTKSPGKIFSNNHFLDDEKFDVITLWHVLEHIPNLFEEIPRLKKTLQPNGTLFVAVPNYESYDAQHYQEFWAAYDVPRHLWHFNQNAMKNILEQFGMIIESIKPMYFDSYYVSMLSEKHKKSSLGIMKAMAVGSISNLKGIQNGQFSSLIYQIRAKN